MGIVNTRIDVEVKDRDGNVRRLRSAEGLQEVGPCVEVRLAPLGTDFESGLDAGETPPAVVSGRALIDTGALVTCFDAGAAERAGLAVVGTGTVTSVRHADEVVPIFAGSLHIDWISVSVNARHAMGVNLESQGLIALIGRDLLANCLFVYNGLEGSFSFAVQVVDFGYPICFFWFGSIGRPSSRMGVFCVWVMNHQLLHGVREFQPSHRLWRSGSTFRILTGGSILAAQIG